MYYRQLLSFWCHTKGRTGLTIPFIIGLNKKFNLNKSIFDTKSLLLAIYDDVELESEPILVRYCSDMDEYILGLDEKVWPIKNHFKNIGTICLANEELENDINNINELVDFFDRRYSALIEKSQFSKVGRNKWSTFTHENECLINEFIQSYPADTQTPPAHY